MPFDIIGHKETFEDDLKITFENVELIHQCDIKLAQNSDKKITPKNQENILMDFFSQIPKSLLWKIFKYYELDFDLFGYNKTEAFKYVMAGIEDNET